MIKRSNFFLSFHLQFLQEVLGKGKHLPLLELLVEGVAGMMKGWGAWVMEGWGAGVMKGWGAGVMEGWGTEVVKRWGAGVMKELGGYPKHFFLLERTTEVC